MLNIILHILESLCKASKGRKLKEKNNMQKVKLSLAAAVPLVLMILLVAAPLTSTPTLANPISALLADQPGPLNTGDTWTYGMYYNSTHNYTARLTVVGLTTVEDWNGTMTQCYKIEGKFEDQPEPFNESWVSIYYRVSDLKMIAQEGYELKNNSGTYLEHYWYVYTDVPIENGYPLSLGKTWNQTITTNRTGYLKEWSGGGWSNTTWTRSNATSFTGWQSGEVLNISTVTVLAGTFETWCINITAGKDTETKTFIHYFSPGVKNNVLITNSTGDWQSWLVSYNVGLHIEDILRILIWSQALQQITSPLAGSKLFLWTGAGAAAVILIAVGIFLWLRRR